MAKKQKFNIEVTQKVMIFLIAAIVLVALSFIFFQIGSTKSTTTRTQYLVFAVILLIAIIILYKTIKSVSFKMALKFRD